MNTSAIPPFPWKGLLYGVVALALLFIAGFLMTLLCFLVSVYPGVLRGHVIQVPNPQVFRAAYRIIMIYLGSASLCLSVVYIIGNDTKKEV